jgi:hypothetical protein
MRKLLVYRVADFSIKYYYHYIRIKKISCVYTALVQYESISHIGSIVFVNRILNEE